MSNASPNLPPARAPRRGRRLRRSLLVLGVLGTVSLFTHSLWLPPLITRAAPALARRLAGLELRLEGLERVDLRGLRVAEIELRQLGEHAVLAELQARDVELDFGPTLLLGRLEALSTLRCGALHVDLVPANASATGSPPQELPSQGRTGLLPANLPLISIDRLEVVIRRLEAPPIQITEASLSVDELGRLELAAHHGERAASLSAIWRGRALEELELTVDGRSLVRNSRIDLTEVEEGNLEADLQLGIGASGNRARASLESGELSWEATLAGIDLEQLEQQLPLRLDQELAGKLELRTSGRLDLAAPTAGKAHLEFELGPFAAAGWSGEGAHGALLLENGALNVDSLEVLQGANNRLQVEAAHLPLEGTGAANWLKRAQGQLSLELRDLAAVLAAAGLHAGPARGHLDHRLALRAELSAGRLKIVEGALESEAGRVVLEQGELWLSETDHGALALALEGTAELSSLENFSRLFGREGWSGECRGRVDLTGTWPAIMGGLSLSGDELMIEGQELGRLELELASAGTTGRLELRRLHCSSPLGILDARASLELLAEPPSLDLEQLRLERNGLGLNLTEPVHAEFASTGWRLPPTVLAGDAGEVEVAAKGSQGEMEFELDLRSLQPGLFLDPEAPEVPRFERAQLEARGSLSPNGLEFHSTGTLTALAHEALPQPVDITWRVHQRAGRLHLETLEASGGGRLNVSAHGSLPLKLYPTFELSPDTLELDAQVKLPLEMLAAQHAGLLVLDARLGGEWRALTGTIELAGTDLRLPPEQHPGELPDGNISGSLTLGPGLSWTDLGIHFGELIDARSSGQLHAPVDVTAWIEQPRNVLDATEVEARLILGELDVESLAPILSNYHEATGILRAGRVTGEFAAQGKLGAPRIDGRLMVDGGRVRLGGGLPSIEALEARLEMSNSLLELESLTGTLGASPFEVTGTADLRAESPVLDLALHGKDLLLFRDRSTKLRADTDLLLHGPLEQLVVSGRIELTGGNYRPDAKFLNLRPARPTSGVRGFQLFSLREPPLRDARFDVELVSRAPFELRSTLVRGSMRPNLHLGGDGSVPVLTGDVFLDRTLLELPATRLELTGGTVRFEQENPFLPQVDVVGQTRILGHDVRASISGDYDSPEVILTSTPPLPQEDLFLLVLTGKVPSDTERVDALSTANTVAVYLARDTLTRILGGGGTIDEDSLLERLDFSYGEDISKNGAETLDVHYRLTSKENPGPEQGNFSHVYLTAERDKYEEYNYGLRIVFRLRR